MANEGIVTHFLLLQKCCKMWLWVALLMYKKDILLLKNAAIGGNIAKNFDEP